MLLGALVMYRHDGSEFATYGEALWFTLQTATTVGYGDMTPQRTVGRFVAAGVMLVSLALLTVVTATITSRIWPRAAADPGAGASAVAASRRPHGRTAKSRLPG